MSWFSCTGNTNWKEFIVGLGFSWEQLTVKMSRISSSNKHRRTTHRLWFSGRRTYIRLIFIWRFRLLNTLYINWRFCFLFEHFVKEGNFFRSTLLELRHVHDGFGDFRNNLGLSGLTVRFDYHKVRLRWFCGQDQREGLAILVDNGLTVDCKTRRRRRICDQNVIKHQISKCRIGPAIAKLTDNSFNMGLKMKC